MFFLGMLAGAIMVIVIAALVFWLFFKQIFPHQYDDSEET